MKQDSLIVRFFQKVEIRSADPDECWKWTGCIVRGYGQIAAGGGVRSLLGAHRVSWEIAHGPLPLAAVVRHRCDNPACVRPSHLVLGTQFDNMRDMSRRSRGVQSKKGLPFGVYKHCNQWGVRVKIGKVGKFLGNFDTLEEAARVARIYRDRANGVTP